MEMGRIYFERPYVSCPYCGKGGKIFIAEEEDISRLIWQCTNCFDLFCENIMRTDLTGDFSLKEGCDI